MSPSLRPASRFLATVSLALLSAACSQGDRGAPGTSRARPLVATSFYPTTWLVERLAGDAVDVECLLPHGADPAFWEPDRTTLARFQDADLVVLNGAGLERWAATASLPPSRTVEAAAAFHDHWRTYPGITHSHGAQGPHSHVGVDPHTWLAPELFRREADTVERALVAHGLVEEGAGARALASVGEDLLALEREIDEQVLSRVAGVRLLSTHPAYDYVLGRDGVDLVHVPLDPDSPLDDDERAAVTKAMQGAERGVLLWEVPPREDLARELREDWGLPSAVYSPDENPDAAARTAEDFLAVQHANVARLTQALEEVTGG